MAKISVPDIEHPVFCWKQCLTPPHAMVRCDRKKGHSGPHSWELVQCATCAKAQR